MRFGTNLRTFAARRRPWWRGTWWRPRSPGVVSIEAIVPSTFVLISQNNLTRQSRAHLEEGGQVTPPE
jgi:hypothetical protein